MFHLCEVCAYATEAHHSANFRVIMGDSCTASSTPTPLKPRSGSTRCESVLAPEGPERAHYLLEQLVAKARRDGAYLPYSPNTAYLNTIPPQLEERSPGDYELEHRLRSFVRWNAVAMVLRAGKRNLDLGGHIASFASAATLYDVGFNHFWRAPTKDFGGDLVYFQGHSAPGIYARAFVEGRLGEDQLDMFRQEVDGRGVSSYPHPWLMPDFWQFPTVSMGLGPLQAIYQARFLRYLHDRGLANTEGRKVWAFMGDGEMDEPESRGAISLPPREALDNLIFVINCNLQRLDGPVRGNGKIIQELEAEFSGAGWNVIKVIWGAYWDPLIARDKTGILLKRMEDAVDGEYQKFKSRDGAYVREHFFGKYPELREMVAKMSDEDIWRLNRGGHDPHKVYAAYAQANKHEGQPTVILAKTVKGYGMGAVGEGKNIAHQQKKMPIEALRQFRDRFQIPITDDKLADIPYYRPAPDSIEGKYIRDLREKLGGPLPQRRRKSVSLEPAKVEPFKPLLEATAEGREISTTMAFVRLLTGLVKDPNIGKRIVPIVPDESRTFGMEGLFRQLGIYSQIGQLYEPEDSDQLMFYKEDKNGQILQEGINEAGATCVLDRRRNVVRQQRRADDPVLHLLFDVRDAAGRRPHLGRRRSAHPRLPPRGDRGTHDAERRGAAARGRPQPCPGRHCPQLRRLRPDVRVRGGGHHPGRPAPDGPGAGGRLLLHHPHERELLAPGPSRKARARGS